MNNPDLSKTMAAQQEQRAIMMPAVQQQTSLFSSGVNPEGSFFMQALAMAQTLSKSALVPDTYKNRPENCLIAMDIADQLHIRPFTVMQNLHIIKGRPSWSSSYISAVIRTKFPKVKLEQGYLNNDSTDPDNRCCRVVATDIDGEVYKGTFVSIKMAKAEGWYNKDGSKWKTMPELMLSYRAHAFFGRVYCPDILLGMQTEFESEDIPDPQDKPELLAKLEDKAHKIQETTTIMVDEAVPIDPPPPVRPDKEKTTKPISPSQISDSVDPKPKTKRAKDFQDDINAAYERMQLQIIRSEIETSKLSATTQKGLIELLEKKYDQLEKDAIIPAEAPNEEPQAEVEAPPEIVETEDYKLWLEAIEEAEDENSLNIIVQQILGQEVEGQAGLLRAVEEKTKFFQEQVEAPTLPPTEEKTFTNAIMTGMKDVLLKRITDLAGTTDTNTDKFNQLIMKLTNNKYMNFTMFSDDDVEYHLKDDPKINNITHKWNQLNEMKKQMAALQGGE